jgi:predicted nucleic acid-binding protein
MTAGALRLLAERSNQDWSRTDRLSFVVMRRRNVHEALTADHHFQQAGFRPVLAGPSEHGSVD